MLLYHVIVVIISYYDFDYTLFIFLFRRVTCVESHSLRGWFHCRGGASMLRWARAIEPSE